MMGAIGAWLGLADGLVALVAVVIAGAVFPQARARVPKIGVGAGNSYFAAG